MKMYLATFFEEEQENEYDRFVSDTEAKLCFENWAKNNNVTLAELFVCNEDETFSPCRQIL